jgi:peptide deformylase
MDGSKVMKSAGTVSDRPCDSKEVAERIQRLHGLSLVLHPAPVLRAICRPVSRFDSTLRDLLQEMDDLMLAHAGIGLAGPQVAIKQRLLICRIGSRSLRLMNPQVREIGTPGLFTEGCLSLPGTYVTVLRPERIEVIGYDDRGRKRFFTATGLWARVIQHERDHLNGMLILDHGPPLAEGNCPVYEGLATSLVETPP